jgi:endoglucanase
LDTLTLLRQLTEAPGPPGREEVVRTRLQELWDPLADEVHADMLGNLFALQRGQGPEPRPRVMIATHMDEIGLIVTGIEGEFLRVHAMGGIDRRVLLGLAVVVHGRRPLPGVVSSRPPHVLPREERDKVIDWEHVFVDVGLPADEVADVVQVGDHITVQRDLLELKHHQVAAKALDNRAGVAVATLALETLRQRAHAWDVCAVATVQEEVGIKGAITSAYGLAPQAAIAVDATFGKQYDDSDAGTFALNKGPTIGIGPNFHPQVVELLIKVAEAQEIPYVREALPGSSGTDAWGIQIAREGIPCGLISLPLRYMHQPVETLDVRDVERAGRLLAGAIAQLATETRIQWEDDV